MILSMCPSSIFSELSAPYFNLNLISTGSQSRNNNDNNIGKNTYSDQKQRKEIKEIKDFKDNTESDNGGILDFLRLSLHLVPSQRLTVKEILNLPIFKSSAPSKSVAIPSTLTSQVDNLFSNIVLFILSYFILFSNILRAINFNSINE